VDHAGIVISNLSSAHLLNGAGSRLLGNKRYELVNHLSNVLVVVSDRKFGQQLYGYTANTTGTGTHTYNTLANEYVYVATGGNFDQTSNTNETSYDVYLPEVMSYSDYYPFHMQMPNRNGGTYRYLGANGQETQTEITGGNSHSTAEYWMYDSRLGRRWNVDPKIKFWESPFSSFSNNPILLLDLFGDDTTIANNKTGNLIIWYNYEKEKIDYEKMTNQVAWDFIEVNEGKNLKKTIKKYLKDNNLSLKNVVFKTHGSSAEISAGKGSGNDITKEELTNYMNGKSNSKSSIRNLITTFEFIGKNIKDGGNFIITACYAGRKGGELGYVLGELLLIKNGGNFNILLNEDASVVPYTSNGNYIYFDTHSLSYSHPLGWRMFYKSDSFFKKGESSVYMKDLESYPGLSSTDKKNPLDWYSWTFLGL
jgi:hypothetical protein